MQEIVESVARVNSIMSEMNNAGREQSAGIDQINLAITDLDHTTQQNAALVEQAAAASQALQDQAQDLERVVSVFKVPGNGLAHAPQAKSEKWALSSTPSARKPAAARKLRIAA